MNNSKKKHREKVLNEFFAKPYPYELDVQDRGDHLKVTSCNPEVAGWWIGTLRAVYPQDSLSGDGDTIKMHPKAGVTLKLTKHDGTLRIKGKKHIEWFSENFEQVLDAGAKELAAVNEMAKKCDQYLKLQDSFTVRDLLNSLPASGAFKQGPSYVYRLWRGLLDAWIAAAGADVYVVSPLLDAKRLSDVLLMLVKHKLSGTRVHLMCLNRCDADAKFPKVLKDAKDLIRELKAANKKRLVAEERLRLAEQRLDVRFGRFHSKLIAMCGAGGRAEVLVTSASFHRVHFETEGGDTLAHFRLSTSELVNNYLAPLGLAHQVLLDNGGVEEDRSIMSAASDRSLASSLAPSLHARSPPHSPNSPTAPALRPASAQPRSSSMVARSHSMSPGPLSPGGPASPISRSTPTVNKLSPTPAHAAAVRLSSPSIHQHAVNVNSNNNSYSSAGGGEGTSRNNNSYSSAGGGEGTSYNSRNNNSYGSAGGGGEGHSFNSGGGTSHSHNSQNNNNVYTSTPHTTGAGVMNNSGGNNKVIVPPYYNTGNAEEENEEDGDGECDQTSQQASEQGVENHTSSSSSVVRMEYHQQQQYHHQHTTTITTTTENTTVVAGNLDS